MKQRPVLSAVSRLQGNNAALINGTIIPDQFDLAFEDVPVLVHAFRRMVRQLEFDVCEMALTTYLCAREHGVQFTAIPVFLVRMFHHGAILQNIKFPVTHPKELEGRRVGVNRGYTVTTGVWARAVLQEEYGVDLNKITWVLSGDEHVEEYRAPENVVSIAPGETIEEQLSSGELAAAINIRTENPAFQSLIPRPLEAGLAAYRSRGHYPINHLIAVRNDVLDAHPGVAIDLFNAFARSKDAYLDKLKIGALENPSELDAMHARILELGDDPLPYGVEPNRPVLERLIEHALTQRILRKAVAVDSVFAAETLTLS